MMFKIVVIICLNLVSIIAAYFTMVYIYKEKDPRKWKPILSTKDDTCYSMFKDIFDRNKSIQKYNQSPKK